MFRLLFGIVVCFLSLSVSAQQPYRVIHQFLPSSLLGITLNKVAEPLSAELKRLVIFEHYAGAGGVVAQNAYQNINDDRTFLFIGANSFTVIPMFQKVDYKTEDLEPLVLLALSPMCYAVKSDSKETDFKKFFEENKGKFYGSLSGGISIEGVLSNHINLVESLQQTPINYKSYPDMLPSLLRGDIQWALAPKNYCGAVPQSGLGVIALKNVPAQYDANYWFGDYWFGLFAKKTMNKKTRDEFANTFADTWWKNKESLGKTAHFPNRDVRHEEFKKHIDVFAKKWESLVKK
jgi:tripartite-type tricarboxylate transporter receptor subunit TctC